MKTGVKMDAKSGKRGSRRGAVAVTAAIALGLLGGMGGATAASAAETWAHAGPASTEQGCLFAKNLAFQQGYKVGPNCYYMGAGVHPNGAGWYYFKRIAW